MVVGICNLVGGGVFLDMPPRCRCRWLWQISVGVKARVVSRYPDSHHRTLHVVSVKGWAKLLIPDPEILKDNSFPCFSDGGVTKTYRNGPYTALSETVTQCSP